MGVCWGFLLSLSCWILLHRTVVELSLGTDRPDTGEPAIRCTARIIVLCSVKSVW